jgi:NADH:ubiquinone oxidoreductase subunit 3 (subunit A)
MKTQMKFQKILSLVTLILAALSFIYAICFFSTGLSELLHYTTDSAGYDAIGCDHVVEYGQSINEMFVILGIIFIVLAITLFITASNKRRNYYITNYISVIAVAAFALVFAIIGLISVSLLLSYYVSEIDWEAYKALYEQVTSSGKRVNPYYSDSKIVFVLGYILFVVLLVDAAALVLNLIWKIKLMKGEKELLKNGLVKEVA